MQGREGCIMPKLNSLSDMKSLRELINARRDPGRTCITICSGTGCLAYRSTDVVTAFERELKKSELKHKVDLRRTGCYGFCERGPIVVILPEKICYLGTTAQDVPRIVSQTLVQGELVEDLLYQDPNTGERIAHLEDIPFYKHQKRIILATNALIDPKKIEDYLAIGGYAAAAKVLLDMKPDDVVEEIKAANLRGRGGGGFPAGRKWETTRNVPEEPKYIIVNADEGDPGAYMDRSLLEGNPHGILEGLLIGAYAIGAHEGFIYVRQEYPLAVEIRRWRYKRPRNTAFSGMISSGQDLIFG